MRRLTDAEGLEVAVRDGVYSVADQADYYLEGAPAGFVATFAKPLPSGLFRIAFDNSVGLAEASGIRFDVQHSKLSHASFEAMLDRVVGDVANLAFDFGTHAALPHVQDADGAPSDVAFHALAYLREVMLRRTATETLQAQFQLIARHPHRKQEREPSWVPVSRATHVGPGALAAVVSHPDRLTRISAQSPLAATSLGLALTRQGVARFPSEVLLDERVETFDTPENRVVKHVLARAANLVRSFASRKLLNPQLREDLVRMDMQLRQMLAHDFLGEVESMTSLPIASTVLQRRDGYRQFLQHLLALDFGAALAPERHVWQRLLDLKDCALLYELWCFFEMKKLLERDLSLGKPTVFALTQATDERVAVPWSATVAYDGGRVELVYNRSYGPTTGSWSLPLRPDLVVRVRKPDGTWQGLVLDAKLKFRGERFGAEAGAQAGGASRTVVQDDLVKMHAYRDALKEVRSAFVLYPGNVTKTWPVDDGEVGALPFIPGAERHPGAVALLRRWIDMSAPTSLNTNRMTP